MNENNNHSIEKLAYSVLQRLCINLSRNEDFVNEYVYIERYLLEQNLDNIVLLDYDLPYDKNYHIKMEIKEGVLNLTVICEDTIISMDRHESLKQLHELGSALKKIVNDLHITFAPTPDEDFVREVMKAEKGTVLNFNNQLSIICTDTDDSRRVFKRQFEGSLRNISLNSFRGSDTYVVDIHNPKDLHYLFGKAYTSLTNTADLRVSTNSYMGQHICTDIERKMQNDSSRPVDVGPLRLYVSKSKDGRCTWYDESLQRIDRSLASVVFGWAKNTIAEMSIQQLVFYEESSGIPTQFHFFGQDDYSPFLAKIKKLSLQNAPEQVVEEAFLYAEAHGGIMSIAVDSLEQDDDNNFIPTTYTFVCKNGKKQIHKIKYKDNVLGGAVEAFTPVSKESFVTFCTEKFSQGYKSILSKSTEILRSLYVEKHLSKNEALLAAIEQYEKEHPENILGITNADINRISQNVAQLLLQAEMGGLPSIPLTDFLDDEPPTLLDEFSDEFLRF